MKYSSWLRRQGVLLGTLALTVSATSAAEPDTVRTEELRNVEVLGNTPRPGTTASIPVYTLTAASMQAMGVTDISDALHRLPGVNLRDYGGAGGLKTVSVRGLGANHTAVSLDGLPVVDNQSGMVDMSRFTTDNMQSLSLTIGDGSDIFISATAAASAATVSISTQDYGTAGRHTALSAGVKTGAWGLVSPSVRFRHDLGGGWQTSANGDFSHAKNDYPFRLVNGATVTEGRRDNSRMNSGHGDIGLRHISADGAIFESKAYAYGSSRRLPGAVTLYNPESHERLNERDIFGQARYMSAPGRLRWKTAAKFDWSSSRYRDTDARYPGGERDDYYIQRHAYATGSALYTVDSHWSADLSADYSYSAMTTGRKRPQPRRHALLALAAVRFRGGPVLATAHLLSSNYFNSARGGEAARDASRLSPSLSVSVRPWASRLFFVRASYKNIFRMPTFADSYYGTTGTPTLRPETTDQLNLGLTWQARRGRLFPLAVFSADVYCNSVEDRIVAMPQNMFVWSMVNVGKVRSLGVDLSAETRISLGDSHGILLAANYSYQRVQPRTGSTDPDYNKQVAYTPRHSGAASATYENPWVNIVVHGTGASARYGTNSNLAASRIAGYTEWGLGIYRSIAFRTHSVDLRADISNIFDCRYELVARYPMPGRGWQISATFNL